jgi:hypothetical protein
VEAVLANVLHDFDALQFAFRRICTEPFGSPTQPWRNEKLQAQFDRSLRDLPESPSPGKDYSFNERIGLLAG